jgi:hypothetical protein
MRNDVKVQNLSLPLASTSVVFCLQQSCDEIFYLEEPEKYNYNELMNESIFKSCPAAFGICYCEA